MNGKGDKRRPCLVSRQERDRNWEDIFCVKEEQQDEPDELKGEDDDDEKK